MRRALAVFLILIFGLAPLASALAASDESRLPPCCRRHGAHHCAMMARWRAQMESGKPSVGVPSTCPLFPGYGVPSIASIDALTAASFAPPVLLAQSHLFLAPSVGVRLTTVNSRSGRSPPASTLG
jgi:hypothetical protein